MEIPRRKFRMTFTKSFAGDRILVPANENRSPAKIFIKGGVTLRVVCLTQELVTLPPLVIHSWNCQQKLLVIFGGRHDCLHSACLFTGNPACQSTFLRRQAGLPIAVLRQAGYCIFLRHAGLPNSTILPACPHFM